MESSEIAAVFSVFLVPEYNVHRVIRARAHIEKNLTLREMNSVRTIINTQSAILFGFTFVRNVIKAHGFIEPFRRACRIRVLENKEVVDIRMKRTVKDYVVIFRTVKLEQTEPGLYPMQTIGTFGIAHELTQCYTASSAIIHTVDVTVFYYHVITARRAFPRFVMYHDCLTAHRIMDTILRCGVFYIQKSSREETFKTIFYAYDVFHHTLLIRHVFAFLAASSWNLSITPCHLFRFLANDDTISSSLPTLYIGYELASLK